MDKLRLIQAIGSWICEDCGPHSDCGINPSECDRVEGALSLLDKYMEKCKKE